MSVMKEAKKAEIQMQLTEFEIPPMQDVVIVGRNLMNMIPEEKLSEFILEEGGKIVDASSIIKAYVNITVHVSKSIDL